MHNLLQKMIHVTKKNKTGIPDEQVNKLTDKYISILEFAANEYENNPPPKPKITWIDLIFKKGCEDTKSTLFTFSNIPMLTIQITSVNEN